jgi:hypothetical protein
MNMAKKKVIGRCGLCLKRRELQLSHLLARGVSKRLRKPGDSIDNPVLVTAKVTMSTSIQVRDYFLCRLCEKRFDGLGENYVLRQMQHHGKFPLLERLRVSPAIDFSLKEGIYSGSAVGLDTEKFAYFALSVVWRSAAHAWRSPDGHTIHSANLGVFQDPIRKYLNGENPFPTDVTVLVTACTDRVSQNVAHYPTPVQGTPNTAIAFLACGIHFTVFLGATFPPIIRSLCCFSSCQRLVFSRNIEPTTLRAYSVLAATTKEVGVMSATD